MTLYIFVDNLSVQNSPQTFVIYFYLLSFNRPEMSENIYEEALVIEKSSKYTYVTCPKYAEDIRIPHWIGEIRNIELQMWDSVGIT